MPFRTKIGLLVAVILALVLPSCSSVQQVKRTDRASSSIQETKENRSSDAAYREAMVGTWIFERGAHFKGELTRFSDGRFEGVGRLTGLKGVENIWVKGIWKIEKGELIETVHETSHPDLLHPGKSTTDKIVSITNDELILISEHGEKIKGRRKHAESPLISEFYEKSRMGESLDQIASMIISKFDEGLNKTDPSRRPPQEIVKGMRLLIAEAYSTEMLKTIILKEYESKMSPDEIRALIDWYESPLGMKCKDLSLAASTPRAQAEMEAYVFKLRQNPVAPERLKIAREIDAAGKYTESVVSLALGVQLANAAGATAFMPPDKQTSLARITEEMDQQRPKLEVMMHPVVIGSMLYTYRSLSDAELEEYAAFETSEIGKKYSVVGFQAVQRAFFEGASRYWQSLTDMLKKRKGPFGA